MHEKLAQLTDKILLSMTIDWDNIPIYIYIYTYSILYSIIYILARATRANNNKEKLSVLKDITHDNPIVQTWLRYIYIIYVYVLSFRGALTQDIVYPLLFFSIYMCSKYYKRHRHLVRAVCTHFERQPIFILCCSCVHTLEKGRRKKATHAINFPFPLYTYIGTCIYIYTYAMMCTII